MWLKTDEALEAYCVVFSPGDSGVILDRDAGGG